MALLENITIAAAIEAAKAIVKTCVEKMRPAKCPLIKNAQFLKVLPRRVGLPIELFSEDLDKATFGELWDIAFNNGVWNCQWIDCAELSFRIENTDNRNSVYVKGICIESRTMEDYPKASLLEEMQGALVSGDCHRFITVLDSPKPIMQKYALINQQVEFIGDRCFFECSTVEIPPKSGVNIALTLVVEHTARSVSEISIVYGAIGASELNWQQIELESGIKIYPLDIIPENQRFRTTYSNLNRRLSSIATESDENVRPRSPQTYRWSGYPQ